MKERKSSCQCKMMLIKVLLLTSCVVGLSSATAAPKAQRDGFVPSERADIHVRSHGEVPARLGHPGGAAEDRTLEAVLGLNLVPSSRTRGTTAPLNARLRNRGPKEAAETLAAAGAAAFKAQQNPAIFGDDGDLEAIESKLTPVSSTNFPQVVGHLIQSDVRAYTIDSFPSHSD